MRTTLTLDDDVLAAAKALATRQGKSLGEIISELTRKALTPHSPPPVVRNGVPLLPLRKDAKPVTLELVNRLRDDGA